MHDLFGKPLRTFPDHALVCAALRGYAYVSAAAFVNIAAFSTEVPCEMLRAMNIRRVFQALLAALVATGLTLAPLAAAAADEHSMSPKMMQMADAPDMMAGMPCCPEKQKSNSCDDCALVAICMLKILPAGPSTPVVMLRYPAHELLRPLDDMVTDSLVRPPPDRPPRTLV